MVLRVTDDSLLRIALAKKSSGFEIRVIFHPRHLTLCLLLMELRLVVAINDAHLKETQSK